LSKIGANGGSLLKASLISFQKWEGISGHHTFPFGRLSESIINNSDIELLSD